MNNKIEQALAKLMLEHPFYASLATKLDIRSNNGIVGVKYSGKKLELNSEYIDALKPHEIETILATAATKLALYHTNRGKNKIPSLWDVASEYAINSLLVKNGFTMHPLAKFSQEYNGLYTEEIYNLLLNDYPQEEEQEQEQKDEIVEKVDSKEDFELFLEQVLQKLAKQDELPDGLERVIPKAQQATIGWRELLYNYIQNHAKIDYTLFPSNKKHLYRGVALPSITSQVLKIAIAVDTSASINETSLSAFLTEIEEIMQSFTHYEIELIECDFKIQNTTRLTPLEPLETTLKGGGATDFRPIFEYLETLGEDFKFLIYFSDGEGIYPQTEPNIETLWVLTKESVTPFGETIVLKPN